MKISISEKERCEREPIDTRNESGLFDCDGRARRDRGLPSSGFVSRTDMRWGFHGGKG